MKGHHRFIDPPFGKSIHIQKHDKANPCQHQGLHYHQSYEIVYVHKGMGTIVAGDREVEYHDGTLLFLGPCIPHFGFSNSMHEDNFEIVIHFDKSFVEHKLSVFPELSSVIRFIEESGKFLIFSPLTKLRLQPSFEGIAGLEPPNQLIALCDILLRMEQYPGVEELFNEYFGNRYAQNSQIHQIIDYINHNYGQKISTRDVAGEIGLTTNSFCRMFKKTTGKAFISYLNHYRIARASKMLIETDDNISTIMYKCGFDNQSYFSKIFLQHQNMSPRDYRKKFCSSVYN